MADVAASHASVCVEGQSLREALQRYLLEKGIVATTSTAAPTAAHASPRLVLDADPPSHGLGHALAWLWR